MAFNHQQYNTSYLNNAQAGGDPDNEAASYEVVIEPAQVVEGQTYWKVIGVHHLKPLENFSNHHVYLEVLDEQGNRVRQPVAWVGWTWKDRRPEEPARPVPIDKPSFEPGGNIAVDKHQVVSVWVNGLSADASEPSDRVVGIRTTHPDEPLPDGTLHNTWGHHSFYVVWQRTTRRIADGNSVVFGAVANGEGHAVQLLRGTQVVATANLAGTTSFRFEQLTPGTYSVKVAGAEVERTGLQLDGANQIEVALALPSPDQSVIHGAVTNGLGHTLLLTKGTAIIERKTLPPDGAFKFEKLPAGIYGLDVWNTSVRVANIELDGRNSREVNLTVPEVEETGEKLLDHYVLFGPPGVTGRRTSMIIALDYLLTFSLTAGFDLAEARRARQVTVIGAGVSAADVNSLRDAGCQVEQLAGDSFALEARLAARVKAGRPFGD